MAAIGEERLREHMAARRLLHVRQEPPCDPAALLTLADLEAALAQGRVPTSMFRVYSGYNRIDLERIGLADETYVKPLPLVQLAQQQTTFVFNRIERLIPHLWPLAAEAERVLKDIVSIGAIASFGSGTGIAPHYDSDSLILMQIEGAKTWSLYGEPVAGAARRFRAADWDPSAEVTETIRVEPGDLLFVPPGLRHHCEAHGYSLHVGILIEHQDGAMLADELAKRVRRDAGLCEPLVRFLGPAATRSRIAAYRERLAELLADLDAESALDHRLGRQSRPVGVSLRGADPAAPGARARLATSLVPLPTGDGMIGSGAVSVRATREISAVIDALAEGPAEVTELHRRIGDGATEALAKLVASGLVRIDPAPE